MKINSEIKILVVDDHPVVRQGISACLARQEHLAIAGEAADGYEALQKARELVPDIILMDINMPHMNGLVVTELLRKEIPRIKVIILSMCDHPDYVLRIIQSGARGYLLKVAPTEELVRAIETVEAGETYFSSDVARIALTQFVRGRAEQQSAARLTNREREVLMHIAEGRSNKEIAAQLCVGVRTVETHRERIMRKLDIHTVAGLTKFAVAKGLVSVGTEVRA